MPLTMMGCVAALRPRPVLRDYGLDAVPAGLRRLGLVRAREASISSCGIVLRQSLQQAQCDA
jgi:hypothetical protein